MIFKKHQKMIGAFICAAVLSLSALTATAATYKDVPQSHAAYAAIDWISTPANGAVMVGDAANNFNPGRTLDKFEAVKIFASAAGFKYTSFSATPEELAYFERSYELYKPLLDSYSAQHTRWNKTADREAAFLLARGIISQSDLAVFVTKSGTTETVTHLPKETAAAWIVKLLGKQAEAEQINVAEAAKFLDDSEVSADHKKLVYYAAQTGIAAVHDGYFSPDRLVTRAELAQMMYNALSPQHTPAPSPTPSASPAASTAPPLQSDRPTAGFHGTVESVFDTGSELCIQADVNGNSVIYRFAVSAVVTIDGLHRSVAHLRTGMTFYAVSSGGNVILSLVARTATGSQTTPAPSPAAPPPASAENEGYVTQIFTTPVNALAIRTHRLRMTGELNTEESQYSLSASCVIKRGNQTVPFGSIKIDDIVVFSHIGNIITSIELFEKDREIKGTLLDKKFFPLTGTPVLTIMGDDGRVYEMRATSETKFTRNSQSAVWRSLRIGDLIEARCEYDMLAELSAAGLRSVVTGVLEAMHITRNSVTVVIKLSDNTEAVYRVDAESVDVYQMRVGKETRLYLDSLEVYNQYTFN